ncbi:MULTISPECIES: hypothetical protein [Rhodobacterales]|uniref:hypothetical protein n=1 Tax=Rhodobacterales TaxID=204455 RepID=UPI0011BE08FA|nr:MULTISPECIES: hypothetical protein [Rhodobacterales]MDO6592118.1 hypothetical protein [Yoonia sp. 1_MG-2023]
MELNGQPVNAEVFPFEEGNSHETRPVAIFLDDTVAKAGDILSLPSGARLEIDYASVHAAKDITVYFLSQSTH